MTNDKTLPKEARSPDEGERPEIYAVKNQKEGAGISRRSFLGAMAAAGALTGGLARCSGGGHDCGPIRAHETKVSGLLTVGDTLFLGTIRRPRFGVGAGTA